MKNKNLKITPTKGRPMLHWIGKKPLDVVRHFPAQRVKQLVLKSLIVPGVFTC